MTPQIKSCFVALFVLLSWLPASSFAAESISTNQAFGSFMANVTGANQQTVNFGSNGQAVLSTASGNLQAQASGTVQVGGRPLAVTATARPDMAKIAGGILKYASAFSGPILLGSALYDLFQYVGDYYATKAPDGALVVQKSTGAFCTSNCYEYARWTHGGTPYWVGDKSAQAACIGNVAGFKAELPAWNFSYVSNTETICVVAESVGTWSGTSNYPIGKRSIAPYDNRTLGTVPQQELIDAIANKSGWPSTDVLTKAVAQAAPYIEPATFQQQKTLTGPATLQGTTTTTVNVDNSTTTKTEVHNLTYEGDKVTVSTVTTSTTVMPDGTTKTETSTQTNKSEPAPIETCGLPGKPVCAVKVDEQGVKADPDLESQKKIDDGLKGIKDVLANPTSAFPTFPTLNFAFTLPTGCTAVSIPGFSPYLDSIDLCPFVSMFHDIMSIVWVMGGLFGAMSLFFRNTLATN